MNFVTIVREVQTRLIFHSKNNGILNGLTIKKSGEFRIDGISDLPQFTLVDLAVQDSRGTSTGVLSCFLRTKKKCDWVKLTDDGPNGLIDWVELVQDSVETRPSDGLADQLLTLHNADGTIYLDAAGNNYAALTEPFKWTTNMAEINESSFTMQMDILFSLPQTKRARRRSTPFAPVP